MAHTIRDKLDGIVSFWTFRHVGTPRTEGSHDKIRCLIKQACGFGDQEYFKLKNLLPEFSCVKELQVVSRFVEEAMIYRCANI